MKWQRTETPANRLLSRRNRRILEMLPADHFELASKLRLTVGTVWVELKYLEKLGLVKRL